MTVRASDSTSPSGESHWNTTTSGTVVPASVAWINVFRSSKAGMPGHELDASGPTAAQEPSTDGAVVIVFHPMPNSDLMPPPRTASSCSGETSRDTSDSTDITGWPDPSAISWDTLSAAEGTRRTRRVGAPTACRHTRFQTDG